jgi:hypothetical protein
MADACTGSNLDWDVIETAPVTSQATGVLAAIVFAGVILLFQSKPAASDRSERYWTRALILLLYVFFVFMVATFLYMIIVGESSCEQAYLEDAFATMLLVIGAAAMLLALCWLTATYVADQPERPIAWVKGFTVLLTVTLWIYLDVTVLDAAEATGFTGIPRIPGRDWIVLASMLVIGAVSTVKPLRQCLRYWLTRRGAGLFTLTMIVSVIVAAIALGGYALVTALDWEPEKFEEQWPWWPPAIIAAVTSLVGFYLANVAIIRSVVGNGSRVHDRAVRRGWFYAWLACALAYRVIATARRLIPRRARRRAQPAVEAAAWSRGARASAAPGAARARGR